MAEYLIRMRGRAACAVLRNRLEAAHGPALSELVDALEALADPDGSPDQGAALLRAAAPIALDLAAAS